jgi:hypothetical protein
MSLERYGNAMESDEIATFLESQGIGTLAFGNEGGGYAIPMSFGYDRAEDRCIFQFAFGDESEKAAFLDEEKRVTLSVYEWRGLMIGRVSSFAANSTGFPTNSARKRLVSSPPTQKSRHLRSSDNRSKSLSLSGMNFRSRRRTDG